MIPNINMSFTDTDKHWYDVGATYTLRVYDILQNAQIDNDRKSNKSLFLNYDAAMFGLDSYPIFDEQYRKAINDMIIRHFLEWEIGYETDFLFREHVRGDMARIMPDISIRMKARAAANVDNMLETDSYTEKHSSEDEHKFLDTPQGQADSIDDNYLTNVSRNKASGQTEHHSSSGTAGSNARTYTEAVWDFETEICNALKHNFMGLFL